MVLAALRADELGKTVARHRVGHYSAARMLLENNRGDERDERVAVDRLTLASDDGRAVDIGIEYHAKVGIAAFHSLAHRSHSLRIFRVGNMVGETSVGLKELAALGVGAKRT